MLLMRMHWNALGRRVIRWDSGVFVDKAIAIGATGQIRYWIRQHDRVVTRSGSQWMCRFLTGQQPVFEGTWVRSAQSHVVGLEWSMRWRSGQGCTTSWSLDVTEGTAAFFASLSAFLNWKQLFWNLQHVTKGVYFFFNSRQVIQTSLQVPNRIEAEHDLLDPEKAQSHCTIDGSTIPLFQHRPVLPAMKII